VAQLRDRYDDDDDGDDDGDDDDLTKPSLIRTSIVCKRKKIRGLTMVVPRKEAAVIFFRHYPGIRKDREENQDNNDGEKTRTK